jgi:hypothetical protein
LYKEYFEFDKELIKNEVSAFGIYRELFLTFHIGCFEIGLTIYPKDELSFIKGRIEGYKDDLEKLKIGELWSEDTDEAIENCKRYIKGLEEEKRNLENAEVVKELVLDYTRGSLKINGKSIKVSDVKLLYFKMNDYYVRVGIEKF